MDRRALTLLPVVILLAGCGPGEPPAALGDLHADRVTWRSSAEEFRGRDGTLVTYDCPPQGTAGSIWGDGPYTDDSSVCTAGVHAGRITLAEGGTVVIRIEPGMDAYASSDANGIVTRSWRSWGGSFVIPQR